MVMFIACPAGQSGGVQFNGAALSMCAGYVMLALTFSAFGNPTIFGRGLRPRSRLPPGLRYPVFWLHFN